MTSIVVYEGDLRTSAIHLQSSTVIETDAPTDNKGKGERFSPSDLLATSLANCMVTIMGIKAQNMDIQLDGTTVRIEKTMKSDPRRVGGINLFFEFPDSIAVLSEKDKTILKNAAHNCPVMLSIHPEIKVNVDWSTWS